MSDPDRQFRRGIAGLVGMVLLVLVSLVGIIVYWFAASEEWGPDTYELVRVQRVADDGTVEIPVVEGYPEPSISDDEEVPLFFVRCNTSPGNQPYQAVARTWFEDDEGNRFDIPAVDVVVPSGCVTLRASVTIPPQVRVQATALGANGVPPDATRWRIEGSVDPKPDGGATASWQSERFFIINRTNPVTTTAGTGG